MRIMCYLGAYLVFALVALAGAAYEIVTVKHAIRGFILVTLALFIIALIPTKKGENK